ncbi:LytR/AlgR family response regulator transcription factor [Algoriphagus pacificus]|uniref:Response regulator transcription factor n=1 Tax=Algoriphagus pacificus TaxID=2811234 RepID=A0ABS3CLR1_9BACT|nr:LytTR family DNA-binding domain-containing protein [Algoriphagus pacificus]MBN7817484.1 response regulator transcription factor [Algoriphagus pacificus]
MIQNFKIGLIDDEQSVLDLLSAEISMLPGFIVGFATTDPVKGLEYIRRGEADILVTDILMPDLGGLEISRRLIDSRIPVIICSGHSKYAIQGFKVDALDFLGKPPDPIELSRALEKAKKKIDRLYWVKNVVEEDFVVIGDKLGYNRRPIRPEDILYMEQQEKISKVKLVGNREFNLVSPFYQSLEKLKSPYMVRIHQSFAVNILKVKVLSASQCELVSGDVIPISVSYREELRRIFENKLIR